MKIAVINFSGNVGKTTLAQQLLLPRMPNADLITVESINNSAEPGNYAIKGKQFGQLQEYLMTIDDAVIDIGASNVEDFVKLMHQYHGSHEDFDFFLVPTVKEIKQQKDTLGTIQALAILGIPAKKIRMVFNRVEIGDDVNSDFAPLIAFAEEEKLFTLKTGAVIHQNEIFEKIRTGKTSIAEVLADETDYKAIIKTATDPEEKMRAVQMVSIKRLAQGVQGELDAVFKLLFK